MEFASLILSDAAGNVLSYANLTQVVEKRITVHC